MVLSRISEIQLQPHDSERIAKIAITELQTQKKVHVWGKIDNAATGNGTTLKDSMEQIGKSCQTVKSLANEQAKTITQCTFDFQQQMGQLSRSFQIATSDVEGGRSKLQWRSCRPFRQFPLLTPHAPVYPAQDSAPHAARPKRAQRRVEEEQEHGEAPVDGTLRKWRREARRSRARSYEDQSAIQTKRFLMIK
jgi:hypothetical protein